MVEAMDIGFIGLGRMGHGMAANRAPCRTNSSALAAVRL
jgi:6-phosphogluconate dehydrogenase (decarboxylating)